jgi:hypothetical protein
MAPSDIRRTALLRVTKERIKEFEKGCQMAYLPKNQKNF